MLAEFERTQAEFLERQKVEQSEADRLCGDMFKKIGAILQTAPDIQKGGSFGTIMRMAIRGEFDNIEYYGGWSLTLPVDLDDPEPRKVTIIAYVVNNDATQSTHGIISIEGASQAIQLWPDNGEILDREELADGKAAVRAKEADEESEANLTQARFYEKVLNRFEEAKNRPTVQTP